MRFFIDDFGRRFVLKSEGEAGVVIDRAERDKLEVPSEHYQAFMDLAITHDQFKRHYTEEKNGN